MKRYQFSFRELMVLLTLVASLGVIAGNLNEHWNKISIHLLWPRNPSIMHSYYYVGVSGALLVVAFSVTVTCALKLLKRKAQ